MKLTILLLIFLVIVLIDKGVTIANIIQVNKNFPEATKDDYYKVERNPIAKWFFKNLGLVGGSIVYGILSIFTLLIAFYLLSLVVHERIALYIIFMLYGLVIANNFYFLLKYSGVIG